MKDVENITFCRLKIPRSDDTAFIFDSLLLCGGHGNRNRYYPHIILFISRFFSCRATLSEK